MTVRVEMEPGWDTEFQAAADAALQKLGVEIAADTQRYAPVRTGHLRESVDHRMEDHTLIVEAAAHYAAYVELGHRIAHGPHMRIVGPKFVGPRPYLRPALYQERAL